MLYAAYFAYLVLSNYFWGTLQLAPLKLFGFSVHLIDLVFLTIVVAGWRMRKRSPAVCSTIDYAVGKPLGAFLLYTTFLVGYSLLMGFSFNNTIRFALGIFYLSIYYFIPYLVTNRVQFRSFARLLIAFAACAYAVVLFQNFTGWQPGSVLNPTSMSYTENVGGIYRTWNPVQQWLVGATSFSLAWLLFFQVTLSGVVVLALLLLFIALTFIRNIYIGFIVVVVFLVFCKLRHRHDAKGKSRIFILMVIVAVMVGVAFSFFPSLSPLVIERFQSTFIELSEQSGTFGHRINMWNLAQALVTNPWLGAGFGVFEVDNVLGSPEEFLLASVSSGSDSGIVALFFRFGLIGMVLYGYLSFTFLRQTFKRIREIDSKRDAALLFGACVYTIWIWVQSIASNTFFYIPYVSVLVTAWSMSDIIWRLYRLDRNQHNRLDATT